MKQDSFRGENKLRDIESQLQDEIKNGEALVQQTTISESHLAELKQQNAKLRQQYSEVQGTISKELEAFKALASELEQMRHSAEGLKEKR